MKAKLEQIGRLADEVFREASADKALNYKKKSIIRWAMAKVEIQVEKSIKALE